MHEVATLVAEVLAGTIALGEPEKLSYLEAFECHAGLDPHTSGSHELADRARTLGIQPPASLDIDGWRDLLLTHIVEPHLGRGHLTFLYDYPASQAALARVRPGTPPLASRFELYLNGVELANGFHELGDGPEQRRRFEHDLARRNALNLPAVPADENLLEALAWGLPECAGVALGFDRLVMIALGTRKLDSALAFAFDRA
jgi:lysyl-tRNA synthetase class 2